MLKKESTRGNCTNKRPDVHCRLLAGAPRQPAGRAPLLAAQVRPESVVLINLIVLLTTLLFSDHHQSTCSPVGPPDQRQQSPIGHDGDYTDADINILSVRPGMHDREHVENSLSANHPTNDGEHGRGRTNHERPDGQNPFDAGELLASTQTEYKTDPLSLEQMQLQQMAYDQPNKPYDIFDERPVQIALSNYLFLELASKNLSFTPTGTESAFMASLSPATSDLYASAPVGPPTGSFSPSPLEAGAPNGSALSLNPNLNLNLNLNLNMNLNPNSSSPSSLVGGERHSQRPYMGDAFFAFQMVYWPIHCVICLAICTLGIFANVTNIVVLTRPNMTTAVNTILSAMAFSDLIVNISNIPYLMHELSDSSNATTFFSFHWALYILFHAHTSVTAHTISIWLTCVLATWRYFVVCRAQSANQRNWSVGLAKRTIVAVTLLVPIFCIPNYLSFAILTEVTETNSTIYKVGFSRLAEESQFIKTFHFWIFSCLTKLLPCVLLTFFTTVLIRKLLSARDRRLRLAGYDNFPNKDVEIARAVLTNGEGVASVVNGKGRQASRRTTEEIEILVPNGLGNCEDESELKGDKNNPGAAFGPNLRNIVKSAEEIAVRRESEFNRVGGRNVAQQGQHSGSSCATDAEMIATSYHSSASNLDNGRITGDSSPPPPRILSQLIVESNSNDNNTSVSTSMAPTVLASCDVKNNPTRGGGLSPNTYHNAATPRSASTCGVLQSYGGVVDTRRESEDLLLAQSSMAASQDLAGLSKSNSSRARRSLAVGRGSSSANILGEGNQKFEKRGSEVIANPRGRSVGSATLAPIQVVKLQAAQRQLSQNETTTRLLIAVMIVFLICESPAGILAALCAILGQDFFENVYQPTGILTDLLALINSSVNFVLYCFMSTQFRITFYQVVLHCPAPTASQQGMLMTTTNTNQNNSNNPQFRGRQPSNAALLGKRTLNNN